MQIDSQPLACMEVWGGNHATFSAFQKAGVDVWVYSRPCGSDASGGDVYYLSSCASGRITRMLLADVAGHGESVSHVATGLRDLVRKHVNTIRTHRVVDEINSEFAELPSTDRFATSVVISYFTPTSTLSVCSAGHPMPLVREAKQGTWKRVPLAETEADEQDLPLGVRQDSTYTQTDIRLKPGDMALCFTDGVTESTTADGQLLGTDGLVDMLNKAPADQPEKLLRHLAEEIETRGGVDSALDDATLLLCRINGKSTTLWDNLAAPVRWLKWRFGT